MKFRDGISRYRPSPKWRSWRPSPSLLVTVASLMVLTGSIAWASDASVRLTATDDTTGQQSGINVLYKDTGNGDYAPAMVRADPNVGADAHVRLTGTNAQGQQTGVNVGYHDTGNGDYAPIFQEVNAQGTPVAGGGGAAPTATPSCADLGGNCTFTSVAVSGSTGNTSLSVAGVQPTTVATVTGATARPVLSAIGATGGETTATNGTAGNGSDITLVSGDGGSPSGTGTVVAGAAGEIAIDGGTGGVATSGAKNTAGKGGRTTLRSGDGGTAGGDGGTAGAAGEQNVIGGAGGSCASGDCAGGAGGLVALTGGTGGDATGSGMGGSSGPTVINPQHGGAGGASDGNGGAGGSTTISSATGGDGGGTAGNGGAAGTMTVQGGSGGAGAASGTGGAGGGVNIFAGDAGANGNAAGGDVQIQPGSGIGTGTNGQIKLNGPVRIDGCVISTATPAAGSVLTASNATTCSFATPAAAGTPVPTATPQAPSTQSSFCDKGVTAGLTVSYVSVQCASSSATEANVQTAMAQAANIQNLYITTQGAQGGSGNLTIKFRKNGADTALTATVTAGAAAGVFSDTTHTFNAAAGDLIDFSQIDSGNATSAQWVASYQIANGVATGTCVLTSATPVAGTFLFAQSSNSCVWSTPTPRATATLAATATPQPTETPQIHAAVTQNTPAAGTTLFFPGPQGTPGIYVTPTGGSTSSAAGYSFLTQDYANSQSCAPCGAGVQIGGGVTTYLNIGLWFASITESYRENVVPYAATASFLTMHGDNATSQPATGNLTCTLRKVAGPTFAGAVDTAVTTSIAAGTSTSSSTDSTHTASFAAGDMFSFKCTNAASTGSIYLKSMAIGFKPA